MPSLWVRWGRNDVAGVSVCAARGHDTSRGFLSVGLNVKAGGLLCANRKQTPAHGNKALKGPGSKITVKNMNQRYRSQINLKEICVIGWQSLADSLIEAGTSTQDKSRHYLTSTVHMSHVNSVKLDWILPSCRAQKDGWPWCLHKMRSQYSLLNEYMLQIVPGFLILCLLPHWAHQNYHSSKITECKFR